MVELENKRKSKVLRIYYITAQSGVLAFILLDLVKTIFFSEDSFTYALGDLVLIAIFSIGYKLAYTHYQIAKWLFVGPAMLYILSLEWFNGNSMFGPIQFVIVLGLASSLCSSNEMYWLAGVWVGFKLLLRFTNPSLMSGEINSIAADVFLIICMIGVTLALVIPARGQVKLLQQIVIERDHALEQVRQTNAQLQVTNQQLEQSQLLIQKQVEQLQIALAARDQAYAQIEQQNQILAQLSLDIDTVAENERGSIAHELHDAVVNPFETQLTQLKAKLELGLTSTQLQATYQELVEVRHNLRQGLLNLHAAELKEHGLYTALIYMTKRITKDQPFKVRQQIDDSLLGHDINENIQHAVYRITQQALQNVIKHAEAKNVNVALDFTESSNNTKLVLKVTDDGKGFVVPNNFTSLQAANHNGLAGFVHKVKLLGGTLFIDSKPNYGTTIRAEIPCPC
jgi:signal transduction histidine kinase